MGKLSLPYQKKKEKKEVLKSTSDTRAEEAVPRFGGSTERRVSMSETALLARSLNVSHRQLS